MCGMAVLYLFFLLLPSHSLLCFAQQWINTGDMIHARVDHIATVLNDGGVLVTGGSDDRILAAAETYDLATGRWKSTGDMIYARQYHAVSLLANRKVLASGQRLVR